MGAISDLWKSERGLLAVLLIVGATVLTALGVMAVDAWREYTIYVFGIYAGAKTVTGAVGLWKAGDAAVEEVKKGSDVTAITIETDDDQATKSKEP